ncbi:hypothetical protein [Taibaiella soli]|uniref:Uncharacterized protein n=1 Tax=Taibaiella soli TaxID=1649169 RepID=A0A2W2AKQ5_9BACT|nr:hypothetical protein [Taibaiella soli]PZF74142.1 hypothetical protein DN068_03770 [Taibaiella soli]
MKKLLLGISFLFVSNQCTAQVTYGKNPAHSVLNFNGNTITFSDKDPVMVAGNKMYANAIPAQVNGEKVYKSTFFESTSRPVMKGYQDMTAYLFKQMASDFSSLPDGLYSIHTANLTIDKKGKLIYFDYTPLYKLSDDVQMESNASQMAPMQVKVSIASPQSTGDFEIPPALKKKIEQKLYNCLLKCPLFSAATLPSGAKVYCYLGEDKYNFRRLVKVANHRAKLVDASMKD